MRIAVPGGRGMLGAAVCDAAEAAGHFAAPCAPPVLDVADAESVRIWLDRIEPDAVINCAGAIPIRSAGDPIGMLRANAIGPHVLAAECEIRDLPLVHVSTDCVFSGVRGIAGPRPRRHRRWDIADPTDLYGRAKLAGEPPGERVTVVRTSFVGPTHGLWAWAAEHAGGAVAAWERAYWSGSTVWAVAEALVAIAVDRETRGGGAAIEHLATSRVMTKAAVLYELSEALALELRLMVTREPEINRALEPTWPLTDFSEALAAHVDNGAT